jgi:hypothetical protein
VRHLRKTEIAIALTTLMIATFCGVAPTYADASPNATVPSTPVNVRVSDTTSSSVQLVWNDDQNEDDPDLHYLVEESSDNGSTWSSARTESLQVSTSGDKSMVVVGLSGLTKYVFRVAIQNSVGQSAFSSPFKDNGDGLTMRTFNYGGGSSPSITETGRGLCNSVVTQTYSYNWGPTAPAGCPWDGFLVHYTGFVKIPGAYDGVTGHSVRFYGASDDGSALDIDGSRIFSNWSDHGVTYVSGEVSLLLGKPYAFDFWYYENYGMAAFGFSWSDPTISAQSFYSVQPPIDEGVSATTLQPTLPSQPSFVNAVAADGSATLHIGPSIDNGGAAIDRYEYSLDDGASWLPFGSVDGPFTITGLTNGVTYNLRVRATNSAGSGPASDAVSLFPRTTAGAPLLGAAVAGNGQALVGFAPPVDNGGAEISYYEYTIDGGLTWISGSPAQTASPIAIAGLSNGVTYSVKVRAVNAVGAGAASDAVSVKPVAAASAPSASGVVAGNARATLSISPPAQINDSALSGYDYSTNNGVTWSHFASVDGPFVITGLMNGTAYQVKVRAVNTAGPGAASDAVTVNPTKLVPATPAIASITRGNGQVTVTVKAPTDVTAQSITGYQYNLNNGALWNPVTLTNGSFVVTGLTNGTNYAFKVRAANVNGVSGMSAKVAVTPMTTASASTIQSIKSLNGGLAVTFGGIINNGGSAAKNYQYSLDGGSTWNDCVPALKLGPTMTIKGLANGTTYQVAIRMVNVVGPGAASNVMSGTAMTTPSAPVMSSAVVGKTSAALTIGTAANGGTPITGYAYSLDNKTWTSVTPVAGQFTVSGLTSFKTYKIYVRASNVMGNGTAASTTVKTLK